MLPNFIIVGAPKAATTSLYHYLNQHPDIFMSTPKEVNFFSREEIEAQGLFYRDYKAKSLDEYQQLFTGAEKFTAIGEGSVSYLFYPQTPNKIKALLPDVKIIILLRNPLERGFSHYLMDYRLGLCDLAYEDIVFNDHKDKKQGLYYQQYVQLGMYAEQLKRYFDIFQKENIRIYLQEDLKAAPLGVVRELYKFIGVDSDYVPDLKESHNSFSMPKNRLVHKIYSFHFIRRFLSLVMPSRVKSLLTSIFFDRKKKPSLDDRVKKHLATIYNPDIIEVEKMIGRDLSSWKI